MINQKTNKQFVALIITCLFLMSGCTSTNKSAVQISSAQDVVQEYLDQDFDNYSVSIYTAQSSSAESKSNRIQLNVSFQYYDHQAKGSVTETETINKTNTNESSKGNNSEIHKRQYDQYREYTDNSISIYSKNTEDMEWKHEDKDYDSALDWNSIKRLMNNLKWDNFLEKDKEYQCSAKFSNFMNLFFTKDQNVLQEYTDHQEEINEILKNSYVKFIFDKEDCHLTRIEMDEVHWKDQNDNNYSYLFHIDISNYGQIHSSDVMIPSSLKS